MRAPTGTHAHVRDRPPPDRQERRGRLTRRLASVLGGGVALFLILPLLGGGVPEQAILGIAATAESTAEPTAAAARAVPEPTATVPAQGIGSPAGEAPTGSSPDPIGERSSPARRLAPLPESLTGYRWPIRNARLTLGFGPTRWGTRIVNGERFHDGLDLATSCGDRIRAAHDGTVLAAGRHFDTFLGWIGDLTPYTDRLNEKKLWSTLPNMVVIDDGNGYRSLYAHFRRVVVKRGDTVHAGDLLGYEGATGRASGCHLHYGLFSPDEVATFGFDAKAAARMLLPLQQIARIDPLLVLPPMVSAGIR